MHEKIYPVTLISDKNNIESILKQLLDSGEFQSASAEFFLNEKVIRELYQMDENPYEEIFQTFTYIFNEAEKQPEPKVEKIVFPTVLDTQEISEFTQELSMSITTIKKEILYRQKLKEDIKKNLDLMHSLDKLSIDLTELDNFRYLSYTIGKISRIYYQRFVDSLEKENVLVLDLLEEKEFIWIFIIYECAQNTEKIISISNFLQTDLEISINGTASQISWEYWDKLRAIEYEIKILQLEIKKIFYEKRRFIYSYFDYIFVLKNIHDVLHEKCLLNNNFFVISGWTTQKTYEKLLEKQKEEDLFIVLRSSCTEECPTKLKNPWFFKHFETLVTMFGIPKSNEIDPTISISVLFLVFYGMMFGDIGHGLVLAFSGFILFLMKKNSIFFVIGSAGLSSVLFGFLYGSFFGFEDIFPALWKRPLDNINYFLGISIAIGSAIIITAMFTHTVNMFIIGRAKEAVFDPNGISGFGLYFTFLWVAVYFFMTGKFLYFLIYPAGVFVFMILLKEIIFGEGSFLMRFIQGFFELFEVLISYLTNTLSFIRLGAFALNHAGLFMAFYMMSQMTQNKGLSFLILVLGNILIIVLEGVIVFIQALRLQMYEYFSRFYNGNGRFFNPDRYKL